MVSRYRQLHVLSVLRDDHLYHEMKVVQTLATCTNQTWYLA